MRVDVDAPDGYPIANVYVVLDGEQKQNRFTNIFGSYYIENIAQGYHEVTIMYNESNKTQNIYTKTKTIDIGSGINVVSFIATTESLSPVVL